MPPKTRYGHNEILFMTISLTNALAIFMELMNKFSDKYLDVFAMNFVDDILLY